MAVNRSRTKTPLAVAGALVALAAAAALAFSPPPPAEKAPQRTAVATPAAAPASAPKPTPPPATAAAAAPAPQEPLQGAGMRAFIDPATGKLRDPEPGDFPPSVNQRSARTATTELAGPAASDIDITLPDGGVARAAGDDTLVYTVATIGPDGTVRVEHAQGGEAAQAKVKAATKGRRPAATEVSNDR